MAVVSSLGLLAQTPAPERGRIDGVVVLTLRRFGFDHKERKVKAGRVYLKIRNRTLLDEVTVRVDRDAGAQREVVRRNDLGRAKPTSRDVLVLTPGEYIVTVEERPQWTARIIVAAGGS